MIKMSSFILTDDSATVMLMEDGVMRSVPVPVENPMYGRVRTALKDHDVDSIPGLVDLAANVREHASGRFMVSNGSVFIDNEMLPDVLSGRLIDFVEHDPPIDTTPLESFWDNLVKNPSLRSRGHLYAFLEHNGIPITKDGCFIAYKRVNENYKDIHTNKFDNSVGAVVSMKREDVDDDPHVTCSRGLHVAAFPYAKDFYGNGYLMEVKVNPMDVVAVPIDYHGQKMRVCKYEVMAECDAPRPDDECLYDYDETADEDVWDDSYYNDSTYDDCDKVDDVIDDEIEDVVIADNVDDLSPMVVAPDSRGRVCVPAKFVKAIGLSPDDSVKALIYEGYNDIMVMADEEVNDGTTADVRAYIVDKNGNIRISAYALGLANIGGLSDYKIEMESDDKTIFVKADD